MSKIGLALCLLYAALTGLCVWASLGSVADPKGSFVLLQLPLALQIAALDWLGFDAFLGRMSWPEAYLVIGSLTFVFLYLLGWLLGRAVRIALSIGKADAP